MLSRRLFAGCVLCAAAALTAERVDAQTASVTRTILRKTALPGDQFAIVLATVEIAPGVTVPWHTHPGVESAYVLEGEGDLLVQSQPDRRVTAADGFQIQPAVPHSLRNAARPMKLVITYVVDKDKPLVSAVPPPA